MDPTIRRNIDDYIRYRVDQFVDFVFRFLAFLLKAAFYYLIAFLVTIAIALAYRFFTHL